LQKKVVMSYYLHCMLYIAFPGPEHTTTEGASEISGGALVQT